MVLQENETFSQFRPLVPATTAMTTTTPETAPEMMTAAGATNMKQSDFKTAEWYELAASQGDAEAQFTLHRMYVDGQGVEKNFKVAIMWLTKAADQGHQLAMAGLHIVKHFASLMGWTEDSTLMFLFYLVCRARYYPKCTDIWIEKAQFELANMYLKGLGVEQSDFNAVQWFEKAADNGHAESQHLMGGFHQIGQLVKRSDKKAVEWYRKAAEQGLSDSQSSLAFMYSKGKGIKQSDESALEWWEMAAKQGNVDAQGSLGSVYFNAAYNGQLVEQNFKKAAEWYEMAASQGDAESQFTLTRMYFDGQGVEQNVDVGTMWATKAAKQGHSNAMIMVETLKVVKANADIYGVSEYDAVSDWNKRRMSQMMNQSDQQYVNMKLLVAVLAVIVFHYLWSARQGA